MEPTLSFHTLRAKLQPDQSHNRKISQSPIVSTNTSELISTLKNHCPSSTMPKRSIMAAKSMSDITDHFTLRQITSNNSPLHDLSSSKTAPSFTSHNSGFTTTIEFYDYDDEEEQDEEEELLSLEEETSMLASARSKAAALAIRAVPRTGSFVTELSKRLAQSEKKGEPISQIIPTLSMRRSVPNLDLHHHHHPILATPPISTLPTVNSMHHLANHQSRKSVPTSTSSPSLMKRSTTITSVHSIASSCNSSTMSASRSNWHFTQWFTNQPLPPPPPPPLPTSSNISFQAQQDSPIKRSLTSHDATKRARVVQELIATEKSYQADMELVQEIYYDTAVASNLFSKLEMKQIFINLLDIIAFEKDFVRILNEGCSEDKPITVGDAFSAMMHPMEQIYAEYCKKHEDAVFKLQEVSSRPLVQSFLLTCKEQMQGRTTCWDLSSLLIKPVQRVLKYPLLLKEIVALTPDSHADYEQLVAVTIEIQQVADHINEIKRRKDMVEQMINDKKKVDRNMVQGINKKFTRRVHRKKQSSATYDAQFDGLYQQFVTKQEMVRQFERGVQHWLVQIKESDQSLSNLIDSLELVYGDSDGIGLRSIRAFKMLVSQLLAYPIEVLVQDAVFKRIESYLKLFKQPAQVIQKRNRKLIDYDRARHLTSKGEIPDKQLQMSAEAYTSLNAHLLEELPTFLTLAGTYFEIIVDEFARVQAQYWHQRKLEWKSLTIELPFGKGHEWDSIHVDYENSMKRIEPLINSIITKGKQEKMEEKDFTFVLEKIPSVGSFLDDDQLSLQLGTSSLLSLGRKHSIESNKKKYDSLFSESQPAFKCVALVDYESPEKLQVHEGDLIQIWLPSLTSDISTGNGSSSSDSTTTTESAATTVEWWYGSLANKQENIDNSNPVYGWLPSNICEKI